VSVSAALPDGCPPTRQHYGGSRHLVTKPVRTVAHGVTVSAESTHSGVRFMSLTTGPGITLRPTGRGLRPVHRIDDGRASDEGGAGLVDRDCPGVGGLARVVRCT